MDRVHMTALWLTIGFWTGVGVGLGVAVYLLSLTETPETEEAQTLSEADRILRIARR